MIQNGGRARNLEPLVREMETEPIRHLVGHWRRTLAGMRLAGGAPKR